ncbi:MAG: hypothetical protein ACK2T3_12310, partial [Candidatus Promineifilaceae bacterium]
METHNRSVLARSIVLVLAGLNVTLLLVAILASRALPDPPTSDDYLTASAWILAAIIYGGLAVLINFHQPRHVIGWLFAFVGFLNAFTLAGLLIGDYVDSSILEIPLQSEQTQLMYKFVVELVWILPLLLPLTLVLQFFPDGRLPSRRWWPLTVATIIGFISFSVGFMVDEAGYEGPFAWLANLAVVLPLAGILGSLAAVVVRFIRSKEAERLQMKWLVYTAVVGILSMLLLSVMLGEESSIVGFYSSLVPSLLAISVGMAILRYRLFDIDIIIRRTLQYGILTGLLVLVYFSLVVIFQSIFVSAEGDRSGFFVVISTLVVAALFNPLRIRVQRVIDRRFYRRKYDAQQVLAQFGRTAVDDVDMGNLAEDLIEV